MKPRALAVLNEIHGELANRRYLQLIAAGQRGSALRALTETVPYARAAWRALPWRQRMGLAPRRE